MIADFNTFDDDGRLLVTFGPRDTVPEGASRWFRDGDANHCKGRIVEVDRKWGLLKVALDRETWVSGPIPATASDRR